MQCRYERARMQFGLAGNEYLRFTAVDCCLADSNHSEMSLYLQHVRAERKGGQREDGSETEQCHLRHQNASVTKPRPS